MPTPISGSTPQQLAQILTAQGPHGPMRALFQPVDASSGHAEVVQFQAAELAFAGGTAGRGGGSSPGFTVSMGWLWITGRRPTCKTRLVVGGSEGTTFFVRSTATADQFYFVGPPTSRVLLTPTQALQSKPVVVIDAANPYAECTGGNIVNRALVPSVPSDAEFIALVARAQQAAEAAGVTE